MVYIKIVHRFPNVMDSIIGPYESIAEAEKDIECNGWANHEKIHPTQHWMMSAIIKEFDYSSLKKFDDRKKPTL